MTSAFATASRRVTAHHHVLGRPTPPTCRIAPAFPASNALPISAPSAATAISGCGGPSGPSRPPYKSSSKLFSGVVESAPSPASYPKPHAAGKRRLYPLPPAPGKRRHPQRQEAGQASRLQCTGGAWRVCSIGTFDREGDWIRTTAVFHIRAIGAVRAGRPRSHWSALSLLRGFVS